MVLDDEFIDLVIKEVKNLWPKCMMVRGSQRHSESNGCVERVNQTVQRKLGGWMKTNNSNNWAIGCRIAMWRINTQVHQTIKDTPYHLTYDQQPRVGISNLPVSADILQRLSTEAELQDLYSTMNIDGVALPAPLSTTDGSHLNDPAPEDAGLDEAIEEMAVGIVDTFDEAIQEMVPRTPLERSAQQSSVLLRKVRDAQRQEKANAVHHDHVEEEEITSPSKGKIGEDREIPSSHWLDMIKDCEDHLELEEIARARVNTVFPIIYCTNNNDINDIKN